MARDGWPKNEKIFDGAASLVFYMDGRNGHPVVQKDDKGDRMDRLQKLMDRGVGWVNLHYAVDYLPPAVRNVGERHRDSYGGEQPCREGHVE